MRFVPEARVQVGITTESICKYWAVGARFQYFQLKYNYKAEASILQFPCQLFSDVVASKTIGKSIFLSAISRLFVILYP